MPGISFYCSEDVRFSGALTTFGIEGKTASEIHDHLWKSARIHTTTISHEGIEGVRVTPNVYTSIEDLNTLVKAIKSI